MEKLQNQMSLYQLSEINVTYRPKFKASERPQVSTSQEVYNILFNNWDLDKIELQEQFKILLLNRANKVIGIYEVSSGGKGSVKSVAEIFFQRTILVAGKYTHANQPGITLVHVAPSQRLANERLKSDRVLPAGRHNFL